MAQEHAHPIFAAIYGKLMARMEAAGLADLRIDLLSRLPAQAHAVLEIGAGQGANLEHYPASVTSIDATEPDPHMRKRLDASSPRVTSHDAAAEALPFDDDTFDAAVSTLVLCSVGSVEKALNEIRRVVRPGGAFLFVEHVQAPTQRLARWQDRLNKPWGTFTGGCNVNRDTGAAIESSGFTDVSYEALVSPGVPLVKHMIVGTARVS